MLCINLYIYILYIGSSSGLVRHDELWETNWPSKTEVASVHPYGQCVVRLGGHWSVVVSLTRSLAIGEQQLKDNNYRKSVSKYLFIHPAGWKIILLQLIKESAEDILHNSNGAGKPTLTDYAHSFLALPSGRVDLALWFLRRLRRTGRSRRFSPLQRLIRT